MKTRVSLKYFVTYQNLLSHPSFRELCGSRLSGLHPFDNMAVNRLKTEM